MALEGTLHDMSLTDLFQIFRMGTKSGVLLLVSGAEHGLIYICEGRPIDAVLVQGTERQVTAVGEDAVLQLLQWADASFTFRHDIAVTTRPARIVHDGEWLVLEGMRRRKEPLCALPHEEITLDTRCQLVATPINASADVALDLDQWRILSQVATCQSVREIATSTGIAPDRSIQALRELIAIGLVEIVLPLRMAPPVHRTRIDTTHIPNTQPNTADAQTLPSSISVAPTPGRGLINAIMRRVRGL